MKITNILLTIIAACLIFQVVQSLTQKPVPVTVQAQGKTSSDASTTLKVDIVSVGGTALDEVEGRTVLPIGVRNTVGVDIKGVDGHLSHVLGEGDGLPVAVLNH
jgi:hypothetical protein